jgi:hypothetical protein
LAATLALLTAPFSVFADAPELTPPFSADRIAEHVRVNNITSVDDLLKTLPESLRSNFSLIYASRNAAQHASTTQLRVILFSDDGRFQMTFTGSDGVKGGNTIEMISQADNGKFQFSSMVFEEGRALHHVGAGKCVACHGKVPRPIWDGYPKWPGAMGSDHDLLRVHKPGESKFRAGEDATFRAQSAELRQIDEMRKQGLKSGRYQYLMSYPTDDVLKLYPHLANTNMHFSQTLMAATNRQIIGELLASERFAKYLPWFLEITRNPDREFYVPNHMWEKFPDQGEVEVFRQAFTERAAARGAEFNAYEASINQRLHTLNPGAHPKSTVFTHFGFIDNDAFALLEVLADRSGVDPTFWQKGLSGSFRQVGGAEFQLINLH